MVKRLAMMVCALGAVTAILRADGAVQTTPRTSVQVNLSANGVARPPAVTVRAGETVAIRPTRTGELSPAIFIYDADRQLVAKNDETRGGGSFEWTATRDATLQVVLYSNSDQAIGYGIDVLPPAPTRTPDPSAQTSAVVRVPLRDGSPGR